MVAAELDILLWAQRANGLAAVGRRVGIDERARQREAVIGRILQASRLGNRAGGRMIAIGRLRAVAARIDGGGQSTGWIAAIGSELGRALSADGRIAIGWGIRIEKGTRQG